VIGILEFKTFLTGTDYPTGKNTRAGTGMGKILYPRVYMGNPTGRIFFMGTGMEWYYPTGMYPLPSLGVHRTVRCASGATVICAQRSTLQSVQLNSECQSRSQRGTGLSGAAPDCPVPHEDKSSNGRPAPISTDRMTWLAHRTCPVCTGLSGAPIVSSFSNGYKIGWWL
jgi:hypothetical protein